MNTLLISTTLKRKMPLNSAKKRVFRKLSDVKNDIKRFFFIIFQIFFGY